MECSKMITILMRKEKKEVKIIFKHWTRSFYTAFLPNWLHEIISLYRPTSLVLKIEDGRIFSAKYTARV